MEIYATVNPSNPADVGFYIKGVSPSIPDDAFEVSEEDWRTYLADQAHHQFVDGKLTAYTQPAPPASTRLNFLDFLGLFTADEQAAIVGSADPRVRLFCLMAAGASFVDLTDPRVVQGTKLLETLNLIAAGRADQVLAGEAASSK